MMSVHSKPKCVLAGDELQSQACIDLASVAYSLGVDLAHEPNPNLVGCQFGEMPGRGPETL